MQDYAATLITNMLNARLNELLQAANPPYIYAALNFAATSKPSSDSLTTCSAASPPFVITVLLLSFLFFFVNSYRFKVGFNDL